MFEVKKRRQKLRTYSRAERANATKKGDKTVGEERCFTWVLRGTQLDVACDHSLSTGLWLGESGGKVPSC